MAENKSTPPPTMAEMLPWHFKTKFRNKFRFQASRSYMLLCLGMGIVAAALPIALIIIEGLGKHGSISHFYYSSNPHGRDALVGSLCAVAVFLLLFQGLSRWENRLLNLAGIAALGVAFIPMGPSQAPTAPVVWGHYISAVTFFVCLAIVAVFYSKGRLEHILWEPMRLRLSLAYTLCGVAMIVLPAAVYAIHVLLPHQRSHAIFWTETAGIWAFSAYWFTKSWEYRRLLGIRLTV